MPTPAPTDRTYHSVQILRAVAATMVVALHACIQAGRFGGAAFPLGNAGVDVFFPISGFVMVVSTANRQASARTAARFALARFLRIAPIYWLLTLAKAGAAAVRPSALPDFTLSWKGLAAALLFTPQHGAEGALVHPPIKPGWTLNLEMFYYALIVAVMPFSRRIALYTPLVIVAVVAGARALFPHAPALTGELGWGSPMALEFAAGMLIGELTLSRPFAGRSPWLTALIGLAIYAAFPALPDTSEWGRAATWGVAGALFLWTAIGCERFVAGRNWARWPMLLGDASYSLYLTHALTQPVITTLAGRAIVQVAGAAGLVVVLVVVPTLLAVAFHLIVEKPLSRTLKHLLAGKAKPATAPATA